MSESRLTEAWKNAAVDPDPHGDLEYELQSLTVIKIAEGVNGRYMFLPGIEDHLLDEEFIVVDPGSVCLLDECR